jgi:glutamate carboxypeptidase
MPPTPATLPAAYRPYLQGIAEQRHTMLDRLIAWANLNSGSHNRNGLAAMLEALAADFGRLPARMEKVKLPEPAHGRALRLRCRPEAPIQVLLCGHMDTVFGPESSFQSCELSADGKRLRGPGVIDMKGGLVAMLAALEAFEASPFATELGWEVLIVPDEEIGSPQSDALFAEAAPRFDFGLLFELAMPDGALVKARMGAGVFEAAFRGRAAHSGRDFAAGRNAVAAAARFAAAAHELNRTMPSCIINVAKIAGGGPTNVVPDEARVWIGVRAAKSSAMPPLELALRQCAAAAADEEGLSASLTGRVTRPPKEIDATTEAIFAGMRDSAAAMGIELNWRDTGGCCDGNNLAAAGLPNLDTLGPYGGGAHSHDEWMLVDSLSERATLAAFFLMRVANGELSLPLRGSTKA